MLKKGKMTMRVTFKVGDRVKNYCPHSGFYGATGTVTKVYNDTVSVKWDVHSHPERYSFMYNDFEIIKQKEEVAMPTEEQIKAAAESSPEAMAALKQLFPDVEWPREPVIYGAQFHNVYLKHISAKSGCMAAIKNSYIAKDGGSIVLSHDYDWELKDRRLYAYKREH